jgi:hypothetical protein
MYYPALTEEQELVEWLRSLFNPAFTILIHALIATGTGC